MNESGRAGAYMNEKHVCRTINRWNPAASCSFLYILRALVIFFSRLFYFTLLWFLLSCVHSFAFFGSCKINAVKNNLKLGSLKAWLEQNHTKADCHFAKAETNKMNVSHAKSQIQANLYIYRLIGAYCKQLRDHK